MQYTCQGSQPGEILHRKQKKLALGLGMIVQSNHRVEVSVESFYFWYTQSLCSIGIKTRSNVVI